MSKNLWEFIFPCDSRYFSTPSPYYQKEYALKGKDLPNYRKGKMIVGNYAKVTKDILMPWEARVYIFWYKLRKHKLRNCLENNETLCNLY